MWPWLDSATRSSGQHCAFRKHTVVATSPGAVLHRACTPVGKGPAAPGSEALYRAYRRLQIMVRHRRALREPL